MRDLSLALIAGGIWFLFTATLLLSYRVYTLIELLKCSAAL
jgi:hypothetical protein